jgi:DNA-binding NarL/FixJ family response regulator
MSCFLYDLNTHKTIGVARARIDPDQLLPSTEDPTSIRLQYEALMAGHDLKAYPIPDEAYAEALKLFHKGNELLLEMHRFDSKARDKVRAGREERLRKTSRRHASQKLSEGIKHQVLDMARRGFTQAKIAARLEIGTTSVSTILKASKNPDLEASEAPEYAG